MMGTKSIKECIALVCVVFSVISQVAGIQPKKISGEISRIEKLSNYWKNLRPCAGQYACRADIANMSSDSPLPKCIKYGQVCDRQIDCPFGDDEKDCDEECRPKELRCKNGRCARICDGHAQCPDKADEQGCGGFPGGIQCPSGIVGVVCDGATDCNGTLDNGEDEQNCTCPPGTIVCSSGAKCGIRCNGDIECDDMSDEKDCMCPCGSLRCPSGKCGILCNKITECDEGMDNNDDEKDCACPEEMIRCMNGECGTLCNGMAECPNMEDESTKFCPCPGGSVRCPSGKCGALCDGVIQCDDAEDGNEDEMQCECPAGSIRCPSGKCGAVCNGVPNCDQAGDAGEDEENCDCPCGTIKCPSGKCGARCDGTVQCDGEGDNMDDEATCNKCPHGLFTCPSGTCAGRCDKHVQCNMPGDNGEDEDNCPCEPTEITCPSGICAQRCDGTAQCNIPNTADNGEDEIQCPCPAGHVSCGGRCEPRCDNNVGCTLAEEGGFDEHGCEECLVFRVTARKGGDVQDAWLRGFHTTADESCRNTAKDGCDGHFRDPIVDQWDTQNIQRVIVSMYKDVEVLTLEFNGVNSNIDNWFTPDRLISSSIPELLTATTKYFGINPTVDSTTLEGENRKFVITESINTANNCNDDTVVMMVVDAYDTCPVDQQTQYPVLYYAIDNVIQPIGDLLDGIAEADVMTIRLVKN